MGLYWQCTGKRACSHAGMALVEVCAAALFLAGCGSGGGPATSAGSVAPPANSAAPGTGNNPTTTTPPASGSGATGTPNASGTPVQGTGGAADEGTPLPAEYYIRGGADWMVLLEGREFHSVTAFAINIARSQILPTAAASAAGRGRAVPAAVEGQDAEAGVGYSGTVNPDGSGQVQLYRDTQHIGKAGTMSWTAPQAVAAGQQITFSVGNVHSLIGTLILTAAVPSVQAGTCSVQAMSYGNVKDAMTFGPAAGGGLVVLEGFIHYDDATGHDQTVPINAGVPFDAQTLGPFTTQAFSQVVLTHYSTTDQANINYYPDNSALSVVRDAAGSLLGETAVSPAGMALSHYFAPGGLMGEMYGDIDGDVTAFPVNGPISAVLPTLPTVDPGPPLQPDSTTTTTTTR